MGSSRIGRPSRPSAATSTSRGSRRGSSGRTSSLRPVSNDRPISMRELATRSTPERLAQEARAFEAIAPGMIHRLADPDARADRKLDLLRARNELEWRPVERKAVVRAGDAERLADAPRPRAQQPLALDAAAAAHRRDAPRRLERPDKHRARRTCRLAHEVETPVDAVGAIDIGIAGRTEHDGIARGLAAERVRR